MKRKIKVWWKEMNLTENGPTATCLTLLKQLPLEFKSVYFEFQFVYWGTSLSILDLMCCLISLLPLPNKSLVATSRTIMGNNALRLLRAIMHVNYCLFCFFSSVIPLNIPCLV